jgi:hypothetical protein
MLSRICFKMIQLLEGVEEKSEAILARSRNLGL